MGVSRPCTGIAKTFFGELGHGIENLLECDLGIESFF
jgi:hypothetical protein